MRDLSNAVKSGNRDQHQNQGPATYISYDTLMMNNNRQHLE